jgi:hypothetical protein
MPDITMCVSKDCHLASMCYRYLAIPSTHWQSYCDFNIHKDYENCFISALNKRIDENKLKELEKEI